MWRSRSACSLMTAQTGMSDHNTRGVSGGTQLGMHTVKQQQQKERKKQKKRRQFGSLLWSMGLSPCHPMAQRVSVAHLWGFRPAYHARCFLFLTVTELAAVVIREFQARQQRRQVQRRGCVRRWRSCGSHVAERASMSVGATETRSFKSCCVPSRRDLWLWVSRPC